LEVKCGRDLTVDNQDAGVFHGCWWLQRKCCVSEEMYGEQSKKNSDSVERRDPENVWLVWTMRMRENES